MISRMKRRRAEASFLESSFKLLHVSANFVVEGKPLKLYLILGEEEAIVDIRAGVISSSEDPNCFDDFLVANKQLKLNIVQSGEEGKKIYFAVSTNAGKEYFIANKLIPYGTENSIQFDEQFAKHMIGGSRVNQDLETCFIFGSWVHSRRASYTLRAMLAGVFSVGPLHGLVCQQGASGLHCPQDANSCLSFRTTRLCHLCGEDNQCQGPNRSNTSECKWSSLPALILWVIKDTLDIFDDTRLSAVCRNWLSASRFYPKKFTVGDGLPWIMQKTVNKSEREFISVTREKKFTIDLPEFCDSVMLSSKDGWFLMKQKHLSRSVIGGIVFLMNPFTKAKIKLPSIDLFHPSLGSFSTYEGYPRCVVLLYRCNNKVTIRTAYPGDELWTETSDIECGRKCLPYHHLLIIDEHVYCFDRSGKMLVYNMASHVWKEVPGSENVIASMMEFEGELVKVHQSIYPYNVLSFFRYNNVEMSWQTLNSDVVKDISWFLLMKWCFCARTKPSKAYSIFYAKNDSEFLLDSDVNDRNLRLRLRRLQRARGRDIVVDDLMDGGRTVLDFPYKISALANWVDIG